MIQPARRRHPDEASRISVFWAACEPSSAAFRVADRGLLARQLEANPVRFGPISSTAFPSSMLEEKLAVAKIAPGAPEAAELRRVLAANPSWWLVISTVEVPA